MQGSDASLQREVERIRTALRERYGYADDTVTLSEISLIGIEDAVRLARINAHWGIASDIPVVGRLLVLFRRVLRLTLRWYINPIVDQQNAFNDAVVRILYDLSIENDQLRADLARILKRLPDTKE